MSSLGHDLTSILNRYVKRKSVGEIKFDEKQKESGIKVCEHIIHQHSKKGNGKDKLRIITQISHVSDNCETPIPSCDRLLLNSKEDSPDKLQHSPQISDYYIKSLALSHVKSKSLDVDQNKRIGDCHKTKVTAIVGDTSSNYERVHSTTFIHSSIGNKIEKENSFTRPVASSNSSSNSRPSSYYSLPSQIHNMDRLVDKSHQSNKKKTSIKTKWKRLFSSSSKLQKQKNEMSLKDIDKLAKHTVAIDNDNKWTRQESKKSNLAFNLQSNIPFKSHTIGSRLQPLCKDKKSKKVPKFIHSIWNTQDYITKSSQHNDYNNNVKSKIHKVEIDKMYEDKPKKMIAQVSTFGENEDFHYCVYPDGGDCTDGPDDDDNNNVFVNDISKNRQRSISGNVSFSHFDMTMEEKQRRPSCPSTQQLSCTCKEQRIDLIVDVLTLVISNKKDEKLLMEKKLAIKEYDSELFHFKNCNMAKYIKDNDLSKSLESWRQSQASLLSINPCVLCKDIDGKPNEDFSLTIFPLLEQMEHEDGINCPIETIEYFLQATCYNHFEKGLLHIIGPECTMKNVALLHYLTRRIVKHIGDPGDKENKKIQKIIKNSEKFYLEKYYPHIKNIHKTMESFLASHHDNDEVD